MRVDKRRERGNGMWEGTQGPASHAGWHFATGLWFSQADLPRRGKYGKMNMEVRNRKADMHGEEKRGKRRDYGGFQERASKNSGERKISSPHFSHQIHKYCSLHICKPGEHVVFLLLSALQRNLYGQTEPAMTLLDWWFLYFQGERFQETARYIICIQQHNGILLRMRHLLVSIVTKLQNTDFGSLPTSPEASFLSFYIPLFHFSFYLTSSLMKSSEKPGKKIYYLIFLLFFIRYMDTLWYCWNLTVLWKIS